MENTQKNYRLCGHDFLNRYKSDDLKSSQEKSKLPDILQQLEDLFNYNPFYRIGEGRNTDSFLQSNYEEEEISVKEESEYYGYRTPQFKEEEEEEDWYYQEEEDDDDDEGEHEGRG